MGKIKGSRKGEYEQVEPEIFRYKQDWLGERRMPVTKLKGKRRVQIRPKIIIKT